MNDKRRWIKTQSFWKKLEKNVKIKAHNVCGRRSRAANAAYYTSKY